MSSWWSKAGAMLSLGAIYVSPVTAQTWDSIRQTIRKRFPEVHHLTTQQLADWLADTNRRVPVLIDARRPDEFALSHLPGARHAQSAAAVRSLLISNAQPVVAYCSVGYRSSALAVKLQQDGITNVFNLEGSIFAWANEGRPIFRNDQELKPPQVHPYDEKWGQLLKPELRRLTPR